MRTTWGTWWAALAVALAACGPAHAFYFEGWPGSGVTRPPSLLPQVQVQVQRPGVEPSPLGPLEPIDKPPVGPNPTPEPATGLLGLLGLGALAVRRWRK